MNDLLLLANHPLWGNVADIPMSQNPNTPEGLESRLSFRIHRMLAELRHSSELELRKLRWTRMDFDRPFVLELLRGLSTRWREHRGIYRRSKAVLWLKIGHGRPASSAGRPCKLAGRPCFLLAPPLGIGYLKHRLCWTHRQNSFWKYANTCPAGQGDVAGRPDHGSVEPVLCATSFPPVIFFVTMPYFGHNKDMHRFWSIWCFPSSDVPKMVDQ
jgi:hypothetical protein